MAATLWCVKLGSLWPQLGGKCGLFARFTDWPRLIGSWVDRCEPGKRFKTRQKQHPQVKSSSIKSIGPLQCGGQPSNAASSAQAFETARLAPRSRRRRRRREHRLVQIERDKVESLTARPGGGDSSSKTLSDVRGHRIPRVSLANEGARRGPKRAEFQANKISPARLFFFGPNSGPNLGRIPSTKALAVPGVRIRPSPHFSLQIFGHVGESLEKRACARDLRLRTEPESVSGGPNRKKSPKPIRAGFRWFHPRERPGSQSMVEPTYSRSTLRR